MSLASNVKRAPDGETSGGNDLYFSIPGVVAVKWDGPSMKLGWMPHRSNHISPRFEASDVQDRLEATPRIELGMEVLQTSALPLGYVAAQSILPSRVGRPGSRLGFDGRCQSTISETSWRACRQV